MSVVLNFVGMVSSPLICFVFPAMFYLKSVKEISTLKRFSINYIMICLMILLGLYGIFDLIFHITEKINSWILNYNL